MRIEVTTAHLERGWPADPCECPVALAVREALAARGIAPFSLSVGPDRIRIRLTDESETVDVPTPVPVFRFLDSFDHNRKNGIAPFAFELDVAPLGIAGVA